MNEVLVNPGAENEINYLRLGFMFLPLSLCQHNTQKVDEFQLRGWDV